MFPTLRVAVRGVLIAFLFLVTSNVVAQASASNDHPGYSVANTPDWVKPFPAFDSQLDSDDKGQNGSQFRFSDVQIDARTPGNRAVYRMSEFKLTGTRGVEYLSQLEFEFDPIYEKLVLHDVSILRGEEVINKLDSAIVKVLQREQELDALIYDGTQTLMLLLNDIRVGDTLRYAVTRVGENPVFQGNREFTVRTQSSGRIHRLHRRVLTDTDQPLVVRRLNTDIVPSVLQRDGVTETSLLINDVEAYSVPKQTPSWRVWQGRLVFSDMRNWSDVVDWALPMYTIESQTPSELVALANQIRKAYQTPEEQIAAALQWVQDEVRYFGVELGANSHRPSAPHETLNRRFGDCKDKTMLLLTLLSELGFDAHPALVDTRHGLRNEDQPYRLHAFDHVIAHLELGGVIHWLDPTITGQRGKLGEMAEPDYGRALIIQAGNAELTPMANKHDVWDVAIEKLLTISPDNSAHLTIKTFKNRAAAESARDDIQNTPLDELTTDYENYYRHYFPSLVRENLLRYDELPGNRNQVTETYDISSFWEVDDDGDSQQWIIADEIRSELTKPADAQSRQTPFRLSHPEYIKETTVIDVPWELESDSSKSVVANKYFRFEQNRIDDAVTGTITLESVYQSLAHEVPAIDVPDYANAIDEAYRKSSMYLPNANQTLAASAHNLGAMSSVLYQFEWLAMAIPLLLLLSVIVWLVQRRRKNPPLQARFYPVSTVKFVIMSSATAGLYTLCWFYRNFRYLKADGVKLVPWVHSLFYPLFFYSLCRHVDRVVTPEQPASVSARLGYLLTAILLVVLSAISGIATSIVAIFLLSGLFSLLILPLLKRINHANAADPDVNLMHSRWRASHFLWIAAMLPLLVYDTAVETRLLAVGQPIAGSELWDFQTAFVNDIIPMADNESVQLFYSSELIDFRRDGNGMTDHRVFSYWADETGAVQLETGDRNAITNIAKIPAESLVDYDSVRISFSDDRTLLMYLPDEPAHAKEFLEHLRSGLGNQLSSNELM